MDNGATEEDLVAMAEERDRKSREENKAAAEKAAARERRLAEERERLMREALGLPEEETEVISDNEEETFH